MMDESSIFDLLVSVHSLNRNSKKEDHIKPQGNFQIQKNVHKYKGLNCFFYFDVHVNLWSS